MSDKDISIIVTGRNDNYDGNFDERLGIALFRNIQNLPEAEFIFVEWNPIMDCELSCHKLQKLFGNRIKYYVVHPRFHSTYCTIDGFLEYPPKNVGIRRATREFVICTNSDVIFGPVLVSSLKKELSRRVIYRATRVDIDPNYLQVEFPLNPNKILGESKTPTDAAGDFLLVDKETWIRFTGYCEEFPEQRLHKDAFMVYLLMQARLPFRYIGNMTHWRHLSSWSNGYNRGKVGDTRWDFTRCGYIKNKETWGLYGVEEIEKDGVTWLI